MTPTDVQHLIQGILDTGALMVFLILVTPIFSGRRPRVVDGDASARHAGASGPRGAYCATETTTSG